MVPGKKGGTKKDQYQHEDQGNWDRTLYCGNFDACTSLPSAAGSSTPGLDAQYPTLAISVGSQTREWQSLTTEVPELLDHDIQSAP